MKVALYARVSMEETDDGSRRYQEPENQLQPLRNYARDVGHEVVKEYVDRGSGADPSRLNFIQMLKDASQHQFGLILVWKLDRLTREGANKTLALLERLKSYRVGVKSFTESWADTSDENPTSELLFAIFSWMAAEERRKISERTKAGIQRLRNIGQWKGGRPKKGGGLMSSAVQPSPQERGV